MQNQPRPTDLTQADTEGAEAIVELDIDAAPAAVWHALTTSDGLASWIGEGSTIGSAVGDELHVHDVVTGRTRRGFIDEVTPHRRLGYTWWPEADPEHSTRVAISLEPCTIGTRVRVIETRPPAPVGPTPQASADWRWRVSLLGLALHPVLASSAMGG